MRDAAVDGRAEELKAILDEGTVAVDAGDASGLTALYWAVDRKHQECVEILLKAGADPRAKNNVRVGES